MRLIDRNQLSANMSTPEKMVVVGNVANNRRKFKRNFLNNSITNRLSREPDTAYETSVFFATIGEKANNIWDELKFDSEDRMKLDIVIKRIWRFSMLVKHTNTTNQVCNRATRWIFAKRATPPPAYPREPLHAKRISCHESQYTVLTPAVRMI